MEDWIVRANNPANNHTQKDAAVAKDALRCNRWIASSALQKAARRGDAALAERAAFALPRGSFGDVATSDCHRIRGMGLTSSEWRFDFIARRILFDKLKDWAMRALAERS